MPTSCQAASCILPANECKEWSLLTFCFDKRLGADSLYNLIYKQKIKMDLL